MLNYAKQNYMENPLFKLNSDKMPIKFYSVFILLFLQIPHLWPAIIRYIVGKHVYFRTWKKTQKNGFFNHTRRRYSIAMTEIYNNDLIKNL